MSDYTEHLWAPIHDEWNECAGDPRRLKSLYSAGRVSSTGCALVLSTCSAQDCREVVGDVRATREGFGMDFRWSEERIG